LTLNQKSLSLTLPFQKSMEAMMNKWDCISPLDARYQDKELIEFLAENAFLRYKLRAEIFLAQALHEAGICSEEIVREIQQACSLVALSPEEVEKEEARVHHDVRAMVNCIQRRVSAEAKPFVHLCATSYDIVDTANAARFRDATLLVLVPRLQSLIAILKTKSELFADVVQVGRTHGQHAVPITFGFVLAGYVKRLQSCVDQLSLLAANLPGKLSGAVGAYNAMLLLQDWIDPLTLELRYLAQQNLKPQVPATQIVQPEPRIRFFHEICLAGGVMADLADDLRHLQRSEISEVGEEYAVDQIGSSTMPQKRNPINFENIKSIWKLLITRFQVIMLDQLCEHQRDLTNSASSRTYGEIIAFAAVMAKRMTRALQHIAVDTDNLERNLTLTRGLILAEPLYVLLALHDHPDAHEAVRKLTQQAIADKKTFQEALAAATDLQPYLAKFTPDQRRILEDPHNYTGLAAEIARGINDDD
jgi:adenylosuccinate lyase